MLPQERAELLAVLRDTPRRLSETVRGLPRALLLWTPAPGMPSILEILCRMRDVEREVYLEGYRRILAGGGPPLPAVDEEALSIQGEYRLQKISEVLRAWRQSRRQILERLAKLREADWELQGQHEPEGPLGVAALLQRQVRDHDAVHLKQIEAILERHAILARLAALPRELERLLEGVSLERMRERPEPERWSMLENLCHLRDMERLMLERYSCIVAGGAAGERALPRSMDPEGTAALRRYAEKDPAHELRELRRLREQCLQLLQSVGPQVWQRRGVHPRRGEISIEQMVAQHLDHDATHLARVRAGRGAGAGVAASDRAARIDSSSTGPSAVAPP